MPDVCPHAMPGVTHFGPGMMAGRTHGMAGSVHFVTDDARRMVERGAVLCRRKRSGQQCADAQDDD